ncbi:hypothetical protein CIPAW_02G054700 [Carya illinoinensis]|uniref:Uncharacterized protein n=1 Tax=Carya illinoinensis TaxID=32201 RepID=A0A8T1R9Z2_CARIL|nr:hypothetical protein CIPAW_02G054700 [Carya illinoinensis]
MWRDNIWGSLSQFGNQFSCRTSISYYHYMCWNWKVEPACRGTKLEEKEEKGMDFYWSAGLRLEERVIECWDDFGPWEPLQGPFGLTSAE